MADRTKIARDSNAELLRLVCMFFIVFHHILVHGSCPELLERGAAISTTNAKIALFLNGLFFPAVNIFILISGYYGIKPTVRKFFNLYTFCAFYGMLNYFARIIATGQHMWISLIINTFFPFANSSYWFIPCYIALFCMAPLLNRFIQESSRKEFRITIILLTFANVWLGYFGNKSGINAGYCAMQMVYMYVIGGFIKRFVNIQNLKNKRWILISAYVLCGALWAISGLIQTKKGLFTYNHPFNILGSIAFFLFAMTFSFKNRIVNWLSASALAVYMIQSAPVAEEYLYPKVKFLSDTYEGGGSFLIFTGLAITIPIVSCLFDKIRVLVMKPIWQVYDILVSQVNKKRKSGLPEFEHETESGKRI
ncbi:MAG: acyltransferase [Bacteroidales bacterium]|nr:acyltransferase [Bacteroidales bacterium]